VPLNAGNNAIFGFFVVKQCFEFEKVATFVPRAGNDKIDFPLSEVAMGTNGSVRDARGNSRPLYAIVFATFWIDAINPTTDTGFEPNAPRDDV